MRPLLCAVLLCLLAAARSAAQDTGKFLDEARKKATEGPSAAGAAVDKTKILTKEEATFATEMDQVRWKILIDASKRVDKLILAYMTGSAGIVADKWGRPKLLDQKNGDKELLATMRAAHDNLNIRVDDDSSFNIGEPGDEKVLKTLRTASRLIGENLAKAFLPKRKSLTPEGETVAKNEGSRVVLYPDFWVAQKEPYPSERCPGIILLHEYFHHLVVNPEETRSHRTQRVYHGEIGIGPNKYDPNSVEWSLSNAYALTSFTVQTGVGELIECVPGWKPKK